MSFVGTGRMPPRSPPWKSKYSHFALATYLQNLRNNRPVRPVGSRPPPFKSAKYGSLTDQHARARADSTPASSSPDEKGSEKDEGQGEDSTPHTGTTIPKSVSVSLSSADSVKGRPLVHAPVGGPVVYGRKVSPTATVHVPTGAVNGTYVESTSRQLEKEEAHNLREALEIIDQRDEEMRIYEAAQDEAADLVWRHRHPLAAEAEKTAPYRNPDLPVKNRRRSSAPRQVSNGSGKGVFPNPEDQIYEEPEQVVGPVTSKHDVGKEADLPLRSKSGNSLPWLSRHQAEKDHPLPAADKAKYDRFEIHKNPPSQSRNAGYRANDPLSTSDVDVIPEVDTPKSTADLEIRSEEIRAATSMKRKDRSPNLPTPTAVSDHLGRPIVSFDPRWRPPSDSPRPSPDIQTPITQGSEASAGAKDMARPLPCPATSVPGMAASAPTVPTINLPGADVEVPVIHVQADNSSPSPLIAANLSTPQINLPDEGVPTSVRPLPQHTASTPSSTTTPPTTRASRLPWLKSGGRGGVSAVSCSSCALPISGRIVTASGSENSSLKARFHPECFTCHHCSTPLECVSFYPEPEKKRVERREAEGIPLDSPEADLRFYCHLDFHEFFSPRCRSCKTPIEGEVIVAAGAEWHVGHFFCAECGDPFDSDTPFVEKDGYAYCVSCHTKRTSVRCRECKKQILDEMTVEALGGKWHEHCFTCFECGSGFGEDGRFFVRDIPVEPTEKEKRKGIMRKMEERAVCAACEERRLKA